MKNTKIEELAYVIKQAEKNNQPKPIFFLGAGASKSGNIPLASDIVKDILEKYSNAPAIKNLSKEERNYAKLMDCLQPYERDQLLKEYIDKAKINVSHIYLAQFIKHGYVDYVLTVNFDNLMLRALSLFNVFPSTYDMAILKDLTTTTFKEKSVVFLHGQHHGLWLLNTKEEMEKVNTTVPRIFDSIKNKRPWVFIGYSGDDPIFEHIKKLGRFDNGLYWVTYNDNNPNEKVKKFLETPNTNASIIKGYDSDSFMLKLNTELELDQPKIINKPFTSIGEMLDSIVDIDDDEHFKGVKERLEISKEQVSQAIKQFEKGEVVSNEAMKQKSEVAILKKEIIDLIINEEYSEDKINKIEIRVKVLNNKELDSLLSSLFSDWGIDLTNLAQTKQGTQTEELYQQAFEKYKKAIAIKPDDHVAFYNWGIDLGKLAQTKQGTQAEELYQQAFEKYEKAIVIKPDNHDVLYNWGNNLGKLAQIKQGTQAEKLYQQTFEKYEKAIAIKPDDHEVFNNWGAILIKLAQTKQGTQAEELYQQAFEKFEKVIEIKPDIHEAFNNWGVCLGKLAQTKQGKQAEELYQQAFGKLEKAIEIKPDDHKAFSNWGVYLGKLAQTKQGKQAEELYQRAFEKFEKAIAIKPDYHEVFNNWGNRLGNLANTKKGKEADDLYEQAFEKFEKAIAIKPDLHEAFYNWGTSLGDLAKTKQGTQAEELYQQAFKKYKKVIAIKPDYHEAFYNWGTNLLDLAKTKQGVQVEELFQKAIEKFKKGIEYGASSYNLSCVYALKGEKKNALKHLDVSLSNGEIKVSFVEDDEDWKEYLENKEFIKLINKYKK